MMIAVLLVVLAVASLFVIARVVSSALLPGRNSLSGIQPLDVAAFRNLIDPREEEYLRCRLPALEFRRIHRKRLRAAAAYVQAAGRNAAILVRMGQMALESSEPRTAEAARQLIDEALLLRRNAGIALLRIHVALLWPNAGFAGSPVVDGYSRLSGSAMLLGRLQNPSIPLRISGS